MEKFTPEMLEKCKEAIIAAKSAEEILALAKKNGIEMTAEKAEELYDRHHKSGEMSDDELDGVAGGGCGHNKKESFPIGCRVRYASPCEKCGGVTGTVIETTTPGMWDRDYIETKCDCGENKINLYINLTRI